LRIEILAGDFHAAEAACREGFEIAGDIGERTLTDTLAICLADAVCRPGRPDEAAVTWRRCCGPAVSLKPLALHV
jgi:hypothetical protein